MPDDRGGFGIDHLPYGVFRRGGGAAPRVGVRLGDDVVDLAALAQSERLDEPAPGVFEGGPLNGFLACGPEAWRRTRAALQDLLAEGAPEGASHPLADVELLCPVQPADYVDFYSSIEHASNVGRMFRPDGDPLMPNWRWLPVGYHGRSGSVVVSGTPVRHPLGQRSPGEPGDEPAFGPSLGMDFELELGFVTGPGRGLGEPIPVGRAREHIFGVALVNDWSARDIQRWEYQPLGPFLAKSFATSIAAWVTPLEALEAYAVEPREQDPEPLPYLRSDDRRAYDIALEVALAPAGGSETVIARTNSRGLYWTFEQQLAHATVNGAPVQPGDLFASGTISGPEPGTYGSLLELTWAGRDPVRLDGGGERTFLQDGDTLVLRGRCEGRGPAIELGEVAGTIVPAPELA